MNLDQLCEATVKQPIDLKAVNAKDAESMVRKALAKLRKATKHVYHVDQGFGWDSKKAVPRANLSMAHKSGQINHEDWREYM